MRSQWSFDIHSRLVQTLDLAWDKAVVLLRMMPELASLENVDELLHNAIAKAAKSGETNPARLADAAISDLRQDVQVKQSTTLQAAKDSHL